MPPSQPHPRPIKTTVLRDPDDLLAEQQRQTSEELSHQVERANQQLLELQRKQEEMERRKRLLEELRRKQNELDQGQAEINERLTRGLVILERQEFELQREMEQVQLIRRQFDEQLGYVEAITPQHWDPNHLQEELTRALATVDQAKAVYTQAEARLAALRRNSAASAPSHSATIDAVAEPYDADEQPSYGIAAHHRFWERVAHGFAYSLPGLIGLFLLMLFWMIVRK